VSAPNGFAGPDAIVVEHVVKQYGELTAVNDVSFTVAAGETLGLLGPNGAGKSTLIRMMTTLVPITRGRVLVAGRDVSVDPDGARLSIGVIPQAMTTDTDLSVEENLSIYAKLYGVPRDERRARMAELLELVGLADRRKSLVGTLSGGMRRHVELARGLMHSPEILFLDEPTTGLDPVSRADVWEMIARIKRARRLTVLITTHYMDEADRLCDRIAIVDKGRLVALDTPNALKASVPAGAVQRPQPVLETGATLDDVFAHYAGHSLDDLAVAGGSRR
jgi:ABC-2 type transport system ATP-binding protein